MGPFEEPVPWSTNGLIGVRRFLDKVIKASDKLIEQEAEVVTRSLHKTIKKVSDYIEAFRFNTAVSEMMKFVNTIEEQNGISSASFSSFLTLLSPFAPHLTNELWEKLGNQELIEKQSWPKADSNLLVDEVMTIVVQVNGKVRANLVVPADIKDEDLIAQAKADSNVQKFLTSELKKQVVVKGKLVNFVV
jgi:leucyl-tRNA synthetase